MTVYWTDPLNDDRWPELLRTNPRASIFHTTGWLNALYRTYGYQPRLITTSAPGEELRAGIVFCQMQGWLKGNRLVSLPFSDHCDPLVEQASDLHEILAALQADCAKDHWKYVEIRPLLHGMEDSENFRPSDTYHFHILDLHPGLEELFRGLHKDSIQRKIRRAEREGLTYEEGTDASLLTKFYSLLLLTRRRHQLPPQPLDWFRNLADCLGESLKFRVASKDGRPIAAMLTLAYKKSMMYKYGCSDAQFHNLGGIPFLFWKTIQDAKSLGAAEFDLGRSDSDNEGLITFKDRLGARQSQITYWNYPPRDSAAQKENWKMRVAKQIFARMPDSLLARTGKHLYRHIG